MAAFNFPNSPTPGQTYSPTGGPVYVWRSPVWEILEPAVPSSAPADWNDITNKPTTFPPTLPIAQSGVTNLTSDLSAKAPVDSPTFTTDPKAPTPATADNDTSIATTAFVKAQSYAVSTITMTAGAGLTGGGSLANNRTFDVGAGTGITVNADDVALTVPVAVANGGNGTTTGISAAAQTAINAKLDASSYTAADVLAKLITVDGAGSGLDADTIDGLNSTAFAAAVHTHAQSDVTNLVSDLAGKAAAVHTHAQSDITNLTTDLAARVLKAGDTMTGTLSIATAAGIDPIFGLNKPASGRQNQVIGYTNGSKRWDITLGGTGTESGSNNGSGFEINRWDDSGAFLGNVLSISRSTGYATFAANVTVSGTGTFNGISSINAGGKVRFTSTGQMAGITDDLSPLQVGTTAAWNLTADRQSLQTRNNGATSSMFLNYFGGSVVVGEPTRTDSQLFVEAAHNNATIEVTSTYSDGTQGSPEIELVRDRTSWAVNDFAGAIRFHRETSGASRLNMASIISDVSNIGAGTEGARLKFFATYNGTSTMHLNLYSQYVDIVQGGVRFPASAVSFADANTLDDYEEGTWTPTYGGQTTPGTGTYTTQVGRYTKIGNRVFFEGVVTWTALTGHSGAGVVYGLPFTIAGGMNSTCTIYGSDFTWGTGVMGGNLSIGSSYVTPQLMASGAAVSGITADVTGQIRVSGHYMT